MPNHTPGMEAASFEPTSLGQVRQVQTSSQ